MNENDPFSPPYRNGIAPFPVQRLGNRRVRARLARLWQTAKAYGQAKGLTVTSSGVQGVAPF